MTEQATTKTKNVKPTDAKVRLMTKDKSWETKDVQTVNTSKAMLKVRAVGKAKPGQITLQLPDDWSNELAGKEKSTAKFVLMRIAPKVKAAVKKPAVRKAAKKVPKTVAKKKKKVARMTKGKVGLKPAKNQA